MSNELLINGQFKNLIKNLYNKYINSNYVHESIQIKDNKSPEEVLMLINKEIVKIISLSLVDKEININDKIHKLVSIFKISWFNKDINYGKSLIENDTNFCNAKLYIESLNKGIAKLPKIDLSVRNLIISLDNFYILRKNINQNNLDLTNLQLINFDFNLAIHSKYKSNNNDLYGLTYKQFSKLNFIHPVTTHLLLNLNNKLINNNDFELSKEWKKAKIYFSFKGKCKKDIKNWRPIISLPYFVKIYELAIVNKLTKSHIVYDKINTDVQKSIKTKNGVWESIFELNCILSNDKRSKKYTPIIFLDIKNAYGSVNYEKLIEILKIGNYPNFLINYVEKYYKNLICLFNNKDIKWNNGLFQGSSLSNLLFLIYLDYVLKNVIAMWSKFDFLKDYENIDLAFSDMFRAFVDDIRIKFKNKSKEEIKNMLDILVIVFSEYGFEINFDKTYSYGIKDILKIGFKKISKVPDNFIYLGQPILLDDDQIGIYMEKQIKNVCHSIDILNVENNIKIYLYYLNLYYRLNKFYELFCSFINKDIYNTLSNIEKYYYIKWNINFKKIINNTLPNSGQITRNFFDDRINIYYMKVEFKINNFYPNLKDIFKEKISKNNFNENDFMNMYNIQINNIFGINFYQNLPKSLAEFDESTHYYTNNGQYESNIIDN